MGNKIKSLGLVCLLFLLAGAARITTAVDALTPAISRIEASYPQAGLLRLEIQGSGALEYSNFNMSDPPRYIIDFAGTGDEIAERNLFLDRGPVYRVRHGRQPVDPPVTRIVLDLKDWADLKMSREPGMVIAEIKFDEDRPEPEPVSLPSATRTSAPLPVPVAPPLELPVAEVGGTPPQPADGGDEGFQQEAIIEVEETESFPTPAEKVPEETIRAEEPPPRPSGNASPDSVFSFKLIKTDVAIALNYLADYFDANILTSDDVAGEITVTFNNVTLRQALDKIAFIKGYVLMEQDDIYMIYGQEAELSRKKIVKVYRLKYVDAVFLKTALSNLTEDPENIQTFSRYFYPGMLLGSMMGAGGAGGAGGGAGLSSITSLGGAGGGGAGAGGEAGAGGGGGISEMLQSFDTGEQTRWLIVKETPEVQATIAQVIARLDIPVLQVMMEVKLIETTLQDQERMGIDWGTLRTVVSMNSPVSFPIKGSKIRFSTLDLTGVQAVMEFLESRSNTKVKSSPTIITEDNKQATISLTTTLPLASTQVITTEFGQSVEEVFEDKEIGIQLNITPQITEGDYIAMRLSPEISDITGFTGSRNDRPITETRSVTTRVTVKDGETLVIGGLIKEGLTRVNRSVPVLGKLPLLGGLFRFQSYRKDRSDLLIFIQPKIVDVGQLAAARNR
jgi:type II secretory pathway component GspD/PulD (secretin)